MDKALGGGVSHCAFQRKRNTLKVPAGCLDSRTLKTSSASPAAGAALPWLWGELHARRDYDRSSAPGFLYRSPAAAQLRVSRFIVATVAGDARTPRLPPSLRLREVRWVGGGAREERGMGCGPSRRAEDPGPAPTRGWEGGCKVKRDSNKITQIETLLREPSPRPCLGAAGGSVTG